MTVKKMIELYVRYELDDKTYEMFWLMTCRGLITRNNWRKFSNICANWCLDDTQMEIIDGFGHTLYRRDRSGFFEKSITIQRNTPPS